MKLSMKWYLLYVMCLGVTLLIAGQMSWSQGGGSFQEYGLTGIERDGDNVKLHFVFCDSDQSSECRRQTLTGDDGLASIVAVLSEIKREYHCGDQGVTNVDDEVPDWDQIKGFIEDRILALQDFCKESICNNDPLASLQVYGSDAPEVYLMEHCGELVRESKEIIEELDSKNRVTYKDLESLVGLLDKARYHLYTVSGKSTGESVIASIGNNRPNVGSIAQHHRSIRLLRRVDEKNRQIRYFTGGERRRPYHYPGCEGVRSGRVAELISNNNSPASSSSGAGLRR